MEFVSGVTTEEITEFIPNFHLDQRRTMLVSAKMLLNTISCPDEIWGTVCLFSPNHIGQ